MKILLINPPFYRFLGSHYNGMNLGLSYIASYLKQFDYEVGIYNADFTMSNEYPTQEELFESSQDFQANIEDKANMIYREMDIAIKCFNPDIVMMSVMSSTYEVCKRISWMVSQLDIPLLVGGPHITLAHTDFDRQYQGDYLNDYEIIPDRESYLHDKDYMDYGYIMSGTGCNKNCVFCAANKLCDGKIKFRSIEIIEQELVQATDYTNEFYFVDDTFTLNKNRVEQLSEAIAQFPDIKFKCDTRLDKLDCDILCDLEFAGCSRIKVGIESGSDKILTSINKGITVKEICDKVRILRNHSMKLTVYLMIGFPNETDNDVQVTIDLAKWIEADYYSLSILTPYPGTKLYDIHKSNNYVHHQNKKLVMNDRISNKMLDKFLNINVDYGKGER